LIVATNPTDTKPTVHYVKIGRREPGHGRSIGVGNQREIHCAALS
jgi:hypothetical protein